MIRKSPLFSVLNKRFNIIILAAGLGTRLKPETDFIPKCLVEIGGLRSIDYCIQKYQYIAGRVIVAVGYCADLVTNYVSGRYSSMDLFFSQEEVSALRGPGTSLLYALDYASSRLPTLITFCDYIVEDQFPVDFDSLGVCRSGTEPCILGEYKTVALIEEGVVLGLKMNEDMDRVRENGCTGIAVFHDTKLLKAITYSSASSRKEEEDVDYGFDVIQPYVQRRRTLATPLSRLFEFGTNDTLIETRRYFDGNR
jgi:NDP-sugar pyrophosphorylase family protein